jgi:signal transduction histidine kinase
MIMMQTEMTDAEAISFSHLENIEVLFVEDSPTQALLIKKTLEKYKLKVFVAKDGVDAVEFLSQKIPQVIISDIEMPRMNGFEFCRIVKNDPHYKSIPVIILTNLIDSSDVIKAIECGADSFLTKPCLIERLLTNISDAVENEKLGHSQELNRKITLSFEGHQHNFELNESKVTHLLLSTYSNAVQKNNELIEANRNLNEIHLEMEKKKEELQLLNEQKNLFLGMAAHDLHNPLTVIQGYSDLLLDKYANSKDTEMVRMLRRIRRSSDFMLHLIKDLLNISAIESGIVSLNLTDLDLVVIIKDCIYLLEGRAEKKKIKITLKADTSIPRIQCDANKIEQVINNLLTNAIKYSHADTEITIHISATKDEVLMAFADQGVGIPKDELEGLFHPFVKTSAKVTGGESSTGLGLAITKKIVLEHHGRIWSESSIGKGSTFYVALPIKL